MACAQYSFKQCLAAAETEYYGHWALQLSTFHIGHLSYPCARALLWTKAKLSVPSLALPWPRRHCSHPAPLLSDDAHKFQCTGLPSACLSDLCPTSYLQSLCICVAILNAAPHLLPDWHLAVWPHQYCPALQLALRNTCYARHTIEDVEDKTT